MRSQDRGSKKRTRQKVRNEKLKKKKSEKSVDVFSDRLDRRKNNTLEDKTLNKLITDGKKEK